MVEVKSGTRWAQPLIIATGALIVVVVLRVFWLAQPLHSAQWIDTTCGAPPCGASSMPLNISSTTQTKSGSLTVSNNLTISDPSGNPDLIVGSSSSLAEICWNGDCRDSWADVSNVSGGYVFQKPDAATAAAEFQTGYVEVQGVNAAEPTQSPLRAAIGVRGGNPTPGNFASGIFALGNTDGNPSMAVLGIARANIPQNYGIYGLTAGPVSIAWAGFFHGRTQIITLGATGSDLIIGGTQLPNNNAASELCINDDCRSTWPNTTNADTYWEDTGTFIEPAEPTYNVAVGGNSNTAPFYVQANAGGAWTTMTVRGTGWTLANGVDENGDPNQLVIQ